ncbi:MAG TPA: hypothetical protein VL481_01955 [Verrucomicrobiae bacterium]|nr:hypothetical protein [Verrucomicrobiae bacterium]
MPLIDITQRPGFQFKKIGGGTVTSTDVLVRRTLGPELVTVFAHNSAAFGMGDHTPENGVQVQFHRYGPDDINVADLWIKVQLSEEPPNATERVQIRDRMFDAIVTLVHLHDLIMPDNFVLDVLWGPTSGCGSVNGTFIEW